jgi:hypothetical protein
MILVHLKFVEFSKFQSNFQNNFTLGFQVQKLSEENFSTFKLGREKNLRTRPPFKANL